MNKLLASFLVVRVFFRRSRFRPTDTIHACGRGVVQLVLWSYRIENGHGENVSFVICSLGLDGLVKVGYDSRKCSRATLSLGHKNLPIERSVF